MKPVIYPHSSTILCGHTNSFKLKRSKLRQFSLSSPQGTREGTSNICGKGKGEVTPAVRRSLICWLSVRGAPPYRVYKAAGQQVVTQGGGGQPRFSLFEAQV